MFRTEPSKMAVQRIAKQFGFVDAQFVCPPLSGCCFLFIDPETDHCHTHTIIRMTRASKGRPTTTSATGRSCRTSRDTECCSAVSNGDRRTARHNPGHWAGRSGRLVLMIVDGWRLVVAPGPRSDVEWEWERWLRSQEIEPNSDDVRVDAVDGPAAELCSYWVRSALPWAQADKVVVVRGNFDPRRRKNNDMLGQCS